MALSPGSRLGRYQIVRQIGAGAMGEVYLAEDPQIERRLAIKTVRVENVGDTADPMHAQLRLRIEREAKAAGRLVHPHVVTLFDAGEIEGVFFLAFEYVEGPNLASRVRSSPPLTLAEVIRIGREAASALDAAHRGGIIHRDIKPANLLLTTDGSLKIADFGIATLVGQGTHLTQDGSLIGTPQYLSPEQVNGELQLDGRSDLFSLGVVLYELLAGKRPFEGGTVAGLLYSIVMANPKPLGELRPDLPPRLTAAVMRLLAKDRDARFPTAGALGAELADIERELATPSRAVPAAPPAELPPTAQLPPPTQLPPTAEVATAVRVQPAQPAQPAQPSRSGAGIGIIIVLALVLLTGTVAAVYYFATSTHRDAAVVQTATTSQAPDVKVTTPIGIGTIAPAQTAATETQPAVTTTSSAPDSGTSPSHDVALVVTFHVKPEEAAQRAIVKVDGLVRGLADGSVMTLRPGQHDIEIVADGFETEKMQVDARDDSTALRDLDITLRRK